ncbi:hypothetical protein ACP70R_008062 [Stipagrostis hirtigluma subsp. patula]
MESAAVMVGALPDDVLAAILGRLPAGNLAASRCVCKAWRAVVDERRLLLRHVVPHSLAGIFVNFQDHFRPHFFARPTAATGGRRRVDGKFGFVERVKPHGWFSVMDHCNGLVLHDFEDEDAMYVCNPTTRRWERLPPDDHRQQWRQRAFLVFDPAVSPSHWEVLLEPLLPEPDKAKQQVPTVECSLPAADGGAGRPTTEWPPESWAWRVLSSTTMRWEERVFVREGEAAGTIASLIPDKLDYVLQPRWRYAVYWQGSLYVHCHGEYVSRLSLFSNKFRVIKSPIDLAECKNRVRSFLGKSSKGVYFAAIDNVSNLRVWVLGEDQTEWVIRHQSNLKTSAWSYYICQCVEPKYNRFWIMDVDEDIYSKTKKDNGALLEKSESWGSDEDNIIDIADDDYGGDYVIFLGFHPYKEVIFLSEGYSAVACHLNSPKVQLLGCLNPRVYNRGIRESFVYMPCMIGND